MLYRLKEIFFLVPIMVWGQFNSDFYNYSYLGKSIYLGTEFEAGSNALSNSLMNKLVWGGYLDNQTKKESEARLKGYNNLGIILNNKLSSFVRFNKKADLHVSVQNYELLNARFNREFYNLTFYGNKPYLGQTLNLANCGVNALRYQELKFGLIFHRVDSNAKIGCSLSFIKGEQLFFLKLGKNNTFFQTSDGSEIQIRSDFELALSDTNNRNLLSFNGIGAAADFYFEKPYKSKLGKKSVLIVNANHIGFIHWRNNSVLFSSDSSLTFSGYNVNSILDLKDSTLQKINSDSIIRSITNSRKQNFNVNLPGNLFIVNKVYLNNSFTLSWNTGFRYLFNANFRPYVFQELEYRYKKFIYLLHAGTGGYYFINAGVSISYQSRHFFARFGSNSLQGFIVPSLPFGQSLFLILAYRF